MLDASPLIIAKLRQHCHHVTGIRVYDYRSGKDDAYARFVEKLEALIGLGGRDLLVSEPRELGGFGFEIGGALYNIDTLKFYEALIALDRGEVLRDFRSSAGEDRVVLEIGAGWGGFAHQFKSLFPRTTYVIIDLPELFLFSGVYLSCLFPDASICFWDGNAEEIPDITEFDFVFVSYADYDALPFPRLDLTLNMVSFQEMTTEQVRGYVRYAFRQGSRFLYSLNRERSHYNTELTGVSEIVSEYFWPHEIDLLPVSYVKMLDAARSPKTKRRTARRPGVGTKVKAPDYRHIVGWRRIDLG
jgi:hypothetical protein